MAEIELIYAEQSDGRSSCPSQVIILPEPGFASACLRHVFTSSLLPSPPPLRYNRRRGVNLTAEPRQKQYDAVIIGSGPNGLSAAITLARAQKSVLVLETRDTVGGGMRSAELTLPGFTHDICSAIHPLGSASPFFRSIPLAEHGLQFIHPPAPLAHPLDDGKVVLLERSLPATMQHLGFDATEYRLLMAPLLENAQALFDEALAPFHIPRHPLLMARFGLRAFRSAYGLANKRFRNDPAKALFAGNAAHSILPLEEKMTAAVALMLMVSGHHMGWPIAKGGSQKIADAMASYLITLGGEIITDFKVTAMSQLPPAKAYLFDVSPRNLATIAGDQLPENFKAALNKYRHGPGAFKLDWALSEPIPWASEECARAACVHVGGTMEEISMSERAAWSRNPSERPFVLLAQPTLFDPSRAPEGKHIAWAYCHVPVGCDIDMTERIEAQIERFAPGFKQTIIGRGAITPDEFEGYNANYIGGDIIGGVQDLGQLFTRPTKRLNPYTTPNPAIFICSASTPPGGGVHGMCGLHAANSVLKRVFK